MSDQRPTLPRFSRDPRVTVQAGGPATAWAGVRRPFGGLLDPGVQAGKWPPAGLSHLSLGGLLADALRSAPGSTGRETAPTEPDARSADESETAEPTVREVLHERETREMMESTATHVDVDRRDGVSLSTRDPGTWRGASPGAEGASTPGAGTDSGAGPSSPDRVTRDVRTIARLVEGRAANADDDEAADTQFEPEQASPTVARQASDTPAGPGEASPVERTMPTVPPELGGPAAASAGEAGGPPTPDVATQSDRSSGSGSASVPDESGPSEAPSAGDAVPEWADADGSTPPVSTMQGPSMTVLQDDPGAGGAGDGAVESSEGNAAEQSGTVTGGDGRGHAGGDEAPSAGREGRASPQTRAAGLAPSGDEAVSTLLEGLESESAQVVQRTIEKVLRQPRVIDDLYHEIERRRRIERERGGDL